MSEPTTAQEALGTFLRNLRQSWDDVNVTQAQLASAIGASPALVSSWENALVIPPEDRLGQYARFFCTHRSIEVKPAALIPGDDLSSEEERERASLVEKLVRLREEALHKPKSSRRETGALGGRFWYFPDGQDVTVICTRFSDRQMVGDRANEMQVNGVDGSYTPVQQYAANPSHPNAVYNLYNGDVDSLLEIVGHIRAENPAINVNWKAADQVADADELTGHVVLLGSGDALIHSGTLPTAAESIVQSLELPISAHDSDDDPEFSLRFGVLVDSDGNAHTKSSGGTKQELFTARFRRDETEPGRPRIISNGAPILEHDVALIARRPNPLNGSASITMCSGLFSRGTYGAVRAFTDATLRSRNEQYLSELVNPASFWMLIQVPVFAGTRTITPDLGRPIHRLWTS